jgi:HEAT repeat protein
MRIRSWILPLLVVFPLLWAGRDALSCHRFKKPGGSVPPGLREPSDPTPQPTEPPPPPPSTDSPPPPTTGTPPPTTPTTPTTPTPPISGPGAPVTGPTTETKKAAPDDSTWETWWELNRIQFFPRRWVAPVVTTEGVQSAVPQPLSADAVQTKLWPMLLKCVDDKQTFVAEAALITMGRVAQSEEQRNQAREILTKKLTFRQHEVARAASLGLFYVADNTSIKPMFDVASDEKAPEDVRAFVALTMTSLHHPMAGSLLHKLADIHEGYYELVGAALMGLGYNGIKDDPWVPQFLEETYQNPKARTPYRALAVESFGRIGDLKVGHAILKRALQDKEIEVRRSAAMALGVLDYRTDAEREIEKIREPYTKVIGVPMSKEDEAKVAELTAQIPPQREKLDPIVREAVKALAVAMSDDGDAFTRNMCAISLGRIASQVPSALALRQLQAEVKKDRITAREYALLALAIAKCPEAYDLAVQAITGKNRPPTTRCAGCIALGIFGDAKADPVLKDVIANDPHPYARGYAALALGMIGTPSAADAILTMVKTSRTPESRAYGSLGLSLLGSHKGAAYLTSVIESNEVRDGFVASHMIYALGLTKDRSQLERLVKIAEDTSNDMYIRSASIAAIGYVSSGEFYPLRHLMAKGYDYMLDMDYIAMYFYKL